MTWKPIKILMHLPLMVRGTKLWSRVIDDMAESNFDVALQRLELLEELFPDNAEHSLIRAYCYFRLGKKDAAATELVDIEAKISNSRKTITDKEYLQLYTEYLRGYLEEETGHSSELKQVRYSVNQISHSVSPRLIRVLPIN